MAIGDMFFGPLQRRPQYETKPGGAYYGYARYAQAIADDCECRCVYCDMHEDSIGGPHAMEIDHFRPWNKVFPDGERKFVALKNEPTNLVHACGICNGFKREFWPTENPSIPFDAKKGWIEPFEECRSHFLTVDDNGELHALKTPAEYHIKQLRLRRPLLRRLREQRILKGKLEVWMTGKAPELERIVLEQPGTASAQTAQTALQAFEIIKQLLSDIPSHSKRT